MVAFEKKIFELLSINCGLFSFAPKKYNKVYPSSQILVFFFLDLWLVEGKRKKKGN